MTDANPSGEERKTMGGNEMSAEELLREARDMLQSEIDWRSPQSERDRNEQELIARIDAHLAQAKAELSALSRASGEAVA